MPMQISMLCRKIFSLFILFLLPAVTMAAEEGNADTIHQKIASLASGTHLVLYPVNKPPIRGDLISGEALEFSIQDADDGSVVRVPYAEIRKVKVIDTQWSQSNGRHHSRVARWVAVGGIMTFIAIPLIILATQRD